jgi:DNA polymerase III subunit delta'
MTDIEAVDVGLSERPAATLFDAVVGQPKAVARLRAVARHPSHAYLLHGPPGSGKRAAARGLAAALLCPEGGCGVCITCQRVLRGTHPDLIEVERSGAMLEVDEARSIVVRAQNRPLEADRQVLVVDDVHLAGKAVPVLLKTVEEPPPGTVFVLVADDTPPEVATLVSRCVLIPFDPVPVADVIAWLEVHGVDPERAEVVARAAGGRLDRAELLAGDAEFASRQELWRSIPLRLNGTGEAAAAAVDDVLAAVGEGLAPLRQQQAKELEMLADEAQALGAKGITGRRAIEERHRREERRWRTDDLRFGLATLAGVYRDRLVAVAEASSVPTHGDAREGQRAASHVSAIERASEAFDRNVNETLLLDSLMVTLSDMTD